MATLPPRKNPTPTRISKQHLTPFQILLQMGFPKHRVEKALAATGNRGVQLASDWLLAHVNDPFLDETTPREYILYACPTGPFLKQLESVWAKSKEFCGWNGAHNYVPHITLVSFFKAPDECAPQLSKALKQVVDLAGPHLGQPMSLEMYTSPNFMGFFVTDDDANYLKRLALQYVKEVSSSTISLEPHVKSLHLTLAYQFPSAQFNTLKSIVETIDPSLATNWELRLYSRDPRLSSKQVHNVLYPHTPRETDELELRIGDYIYLSEDAIENSTDGWVEGASWLTGTTGFLPGSYTQRTAESDAWTMHRTVQLCKSVDSSVADVDVTDGAGASDFTSTDPCAEELQLDPIVENGEAVVPSKETPTTSTTTAAKTISEQNGSGLPIDRVTVDLMIKASMLYDLSNAPNHASRCKSSSNNSEDGQNGEPVPTNRQVYIMRHGERVDFTFGNWIPYCFDNMGNYLRKDLNMPRILPHRNNNPAGWAKDSPLTNIGVYQAVLTGESLRDAGVEFEHVYCSPSYRCVQTCTGLLEGMGLKSKYKIRVEYGLFEWMYWYNEDIPEWCTQDELIKANFNIDPDYVPLYSANDLKLAVKESCEEFYARNHSVIEKVLKDHATGNILLVGHASTLDTCSRELTGHKGRTYSDMNRVMQKVPYCSLVAVEQINNEWQLIDPPCHPVTHNKNSRFDWKTIAT